MYLIYVGDGSVAKIQENGEIVIIGANDRINLKEKNQSKSDIEYFLQLFTLPEERKVGVYTANLIERLLT